MVLMREHSAAQPDQSGSNQQVIDTPDAQSGVSFYDAPIASSTPGPEISGIMRDPEQSYTDKLSRFRRGAAIMLDLGSDLPPHRFCTDALGAARWEDQQLLRDLIVECDPQGRWTGLRKDS